MARRRKTGDGQNDLRKSNLPEDGEYYLIVERTSEAYYAGGRGTGKARFTCDADRASPYKTLRNAEEALKQLKTIPRLINTDDGETVEHQSLSIIDQDGEYVA